MCIRDRTNTVSYLTTAVDIVLRFLPAGTQKRVALCVAIWLVGQCGVFVRSRELLAQEPFSITIDESFTDELTELITRLAIGGAACVGSSLIAAAAV